MKKLLLILVAFLGISYAANAQSCKINGLNDGSTIMVMQKWLDGYNVKVNLSNDSEKTCANVTVVVEVTYQNPKAKEDIIKTYTNSDKCCPNQSCMISVSLPNQEAKGWTIKKWEVKSVSGNKCN